MLFNSLTFLIFLPVVFTLYWLLNKKLKLQNFTLLLSSYIFYGWWNPKFLSLIFLSTIIDYTIGLKLPKADSRKKRRILLSISLVSNLTILGIFKYYNFFIKSWVDLLHGVGFQVENTWTLSIILPVGISFYTFQTMSYTIDIYRNKLIPTNDFISFATFVAFFPQLVAGPIERASHFLPQILKKRVFNKKQTIQGLNLILWGLFKKVVIADSLAPEVDRIFGDFSNHGGGTLWLGIVYFAFQIYCDFSGYSDIAIGTAKLFGIELMSNFKFPYFSRNIGEFWRRWHISLSTWFRDYLYIPLGGSKSGKFKSIRNIFIIFIVSGLWHGANYTFIVWGGLHACLYIPSFFLKSNKKYYGPIASRNQLPSIATTFHILKTFIFVLIGWVFFRSENIVNALLYLKTMLNPSEFTIEPKIELTVYLVFFVILEWSMRSDERKPLNISFKPLRIITYTLIITFILLNFEQNPQQFIYFSF
ncbi:MBOAT family O-acyltransferase [Christiangramia aquimixticola]|uniref:MBOAT family O-acyltransferase n=1 Tax=Christiangramia aquimixticola TaxID=1697558 RepID=UPI003AA82E37